MNSPSLPNLNLMRVRDTVDGDWELRDFSESAENVRCHFRDIRSALVDECEGADAVVGCVAWLTDGEILRKLSEIKCVSMIVQKEDFLRPDVKSREQLHKAYHSLSQPFDIQDMPRPIRNLSHPSLTYWDPVRCVGNHNSTKSPIHPRMHHKFAVFCRLEASEDGPVFCPYKVWTGSFNLTYVGCFSLENAVVISQKEIADAYFMEWAQVACLSEPLDWKSEWCEPQMWIGT